MKKQESLWQFIKEDLLGTDNRFITLTWITAVIGIFLTGFYLNSESVSFLGVAESRESQVNFEYPVEVKKIHVLSGQSVKRGDLLVELNQSEINTSLRNLSSQLQKLEAELEVRFQLTKVMGQNSGKSKLIDPLMIDIETVKRELSYLEEKKKSLYIFAEISGIVGSVNFKEGERVPSFAPLLTVSPLNPTYVHGFIHENLHSRLKLGQTLQVVSTTGPGRTTGKVVSIGARMVPLPERLSRVPTLVNWGREVIVEISAHNEFLLGEKVKIEQKLPFISFPAAVAEPNESKGLPKSVFEIGHIVLPARIAEQIKFEPSGLIYLPDLMKYLVISDDDTGLLLMDNHGRVDDQIIRIMGLSHIEDMESISQDKDAIYIMGSQSKAKSEKIKEERLIFAKVERSGLNFSLSSTVKLRPLLLNAMKLSSSKNLQEVSMIIEKSNQKNNDLETEAHFVADDVLYLALKSPLRKNKEILFLKVVGVEEMFRTGLLEPKNLEEWMSIPLPQNQLGDSEHLVTDMVYKDKTLYFTTSCQNENCSAIWKYNFSGPQDGAKDRKVELVRTVKMKKLEGLDYDPSTNTLMGLFDHDGRTAQYIRIDLSRKQGP